MLEVDKLDLLQTAGFYKASQLCLSEAHVPINGSRSLVIVGKKRHDFSQIHLSLRSFKWFKLSLK